MTRDDIIRVARDAGLPLAWISEYGVRLATLVAAAERDANLQQIEIIVEAAVAAEREACAKVCEIVWDSRAGLETGTAFECAAAIRARGQA